MISEKVSSQSPDDVLVEHCLKGDRRAQRALYEKYSGKLLAICIRYSNDVPAAEDILQEGFVKAFRNLEKFRFDGSFEGWLRRIVVNTAIEHYRRKNHLYPLLEAAENDVEVVNENVLNQLAAQDIMLLIQQLSPGYRTVFNMYVVEGFSHKEIAKQLNITEGTSKSQLARARYILMEEIEKHIGKYKKASGE
jgi:RNA polymerase sigma factor (sigma-70 family)